MSAVEECRRALDTGEELFVTIRAAILIHAAIAELLERLERAEAKLALADKYRRIEYDRAEHAEAENERLTELADLIGIREDKLLAENERLRVEHDTRVVECMEQRSRAEGAEVALVEREMNIREVTALIQPGGYNERLATRVLTDPVVYAFGFVADQERKRADKAEWQRDTAVANHCENGERSAEGVASCKFCSAVIADLDRRWEEHNEGGHHE